MKSAAEVVQEITPYVHESTESKLLGYGESDTSGCWVKFELPDNELMTSFRGLKGQRFIMMLVKVEDDETALPKEEREVGGPLSNLAGRWCRDNEFLEWFGAQDDAFVEMTEQVAADKIRTMCGVKSRAEIDHNPQAKSIFDDKIRRPYNQYLNNANRE